MNGLTWSFCIPKWLIEHISLIYPSLIAATLSALIDIRYKRPALYICTGAPICGIVSLAIIKSIAFIGLDESGAMLVGATIGFLGADKLKDILISSVFKTRFFASKKKRGSKSQR